MIVLRSGLPKLVELSAKLSMSSLLFLSATAADAVPIAMGEGPNIPWVRIMIALAFCLALAVAAIGVIRLKNGFPVLPRGMSVRFGVTTDDHNAGARFEITQRLSIAPASHLVMLKRGKLNYLLYLTSHGATVIDRFRDGDEAGEE